MCFRTVNYAFFYSYPCYRVSTTVASPANPSIFSCVYAYVCSGLTAMYRVFSYNFISYYFTLYRRAHISNVYSKQRCERLRERRVIFVFFCLFLCLFLFVWIIPSYFLKTDVYKTVFIYLYWFRIIYKFIFIPTVVYAARSNNKYVSPNIYFSKV